MSRVAQEADGLRPIGDVLPDVLLGVAEKAAAAGDEAGAAFGRAAAMRLWTGQLWSTFEEGE